MNGQHSTGVSIQRFIFNDQVSNADMTVAHAIMHLQCKFYTYTFMT